MSPPARSLIALLSVLMACTSSAASDEEAIRRVTDAAVKLANVGRWDEYTRLYYADSALMLIAGYPEVRGREAIRQWLLARRTISSVHRGIREIRRVGELAYVEGDYQMNLGAYGQSLAPHESGGYEETWSRQADGSWKVIRERTFNVLRSEPMR
jgi:ketosteroid isomerase-like protein